MRTGKAVTALLAVGMLGLLLVASAPGVNACSVTVAPTGCATAIYTSEKAIVFTKVGGASAYAGLLPGKAIACPDLSITAGPAPLPNVSGLNPAGLQQYGVQVQQTADGARANATASPFQAIGASANQVYIATAALALNFDGQLTDVVLPLVPQLTNLQVPPLPTLADPAAVANGLLASAQMTAMDAQGAAATSVACLQALPTP